MYCSTFEKLSETEPLAGGKARSLALLTQRGFPVPSGFVIRESAFPLSADDIAASTANAGADLSSELQRKILEKPLAPQLEEEIHRSLGSLAGIFFAVRSSASFEDGVSHAWAGIFESCLNCSRAEILPSVRRCWASLFSARAFAYADERGVDLRSSRMAVIIQSMVASEVAGTAFSRHPVTGEADCVVIEAAFGLGEAVVSGAVTPDRYVVDKSDGAVRETVVSNKERMLYRDESGRNAWKYLMRSEAKKASLTAAQASELGALVVRVEALYGFAVDVEWARADGSWCILQARPITA